MSDHAPLPPSGASSWMQCPKWPFMQRPEDGIDNTAANEGTAAHEVLSHILRTGEILPVGYVTEIGVAVDADMQEHATDLADRILADAGSAMVMSETRLKMPRIHADCWGTGDVYWCDLGAETLHVVDFKYGHRFVDAFRNWQLLAYAEGAREHSQWRPKRIAMTIYQPRNYDRSGPWRTWEITADEHDYYVEQMHIGAKLVSPNAAAHTGDACRDCSGRAGCEALQRSAMSIVDYTHEATGDDLPDGPLGKELSLLLAAQDRLKARITGLEEVAKARLRSGANVPGWSLEQGYGRERWQVPPEEVFAYGDAMDLDLRKAPEAITPAQARKKGLDSSVTDLLAKKPAGEIKLVPVSEHKAARAFG